MLRSEIQPGICPPQEDMPEHKFYFEPSTVVTLTVDGRPLSFYGDESWDLRSMGTDSGETPCQVYFFEAQSSSSQGMPHGASLAALIREQQKALLWLHMDAGRQRAQKTILRSNLALSQLARGAYRRRVSLFELFCDPHMLGEESAELNEGYATYARALVKSLWVHREFLKVGVEVRLSELRAAIANPDRGVDGNKNQTPLIPSRIYCAILSYLIGSLDEVEERLEIYLSAYRQERGVTKSLPTGVSTHQIRWQRECQLAELGTAMRALGWSGGSLREYIAGRISRYQLTLLNVVLAFTGMRVGEALMLPLLGILDSVKGQRGLHYVINGFSCKLNGGRKKPASWVTSREGYRAINLARRIAITILEVQKGGDPASDRHALLFCTTENPYRMQHVTNVYKRLRDELVPIMCPAILQTDIDELNALQLERSWMRDGIEVGEPWPLTFHQYRRSLSVYAHRSGMVSLPALKRQLQHITDEMRAYYSDGFCRAVNLVFDEDHFSHEWRAAQAENSYFAYTLGILFSDEDFLGKGANRIARAVSNRSPSETLKLFREGKLAYKENVLGGCVSTDECKAQPLEPIGLECLEKDCVNLVLSPKRLQLVIQSQEVVVATLERDDRGSVEHRLELRRLQVLLGARRHVASTS